MALPISVGRWIIYSLKWYKDKYLFIKSKKYNKLLLHSLHHNNLDIYAEKSNTEPLPMWTNIFKISELKYDTKYRKLKTLILLNKNINLQNDVEGKSLNSNWVSVQ